MLRIYKASAGSGKTYTLVREYLRLAFKAPDAFKHILAITFTNKAAGEMKTRVLESLRAMAAREESVTALTLELSELTGKAETTLSQEAGNILRHMLHEYADISICTIDSFVHRIVRAFAYDLHVPMNFEIEMDSNKLLLEAVDLMLDRLSEADTQVTQAVLQFTESRIQEGKSWRIENDIATLGNELFVDDAMPYLERLGVVSFDVLKEARQSLYARKTAIEQKLYAEGKHALKLIVSNGLTAKDFYYGERGLYGFFAAYAQGKFPAKLKGNSWVLAAVDEDKWPKQTAVTDSLKKSFTERYKAILSVWDTEGKDYFLCDLLLKNFYSFILLADLQKLMEEWKRDNNLLHISDFQHRVFEIVKQQEAPIIYERIGDWYDNILIDEFQDTSVMQWRNLLPLIENSQLKNEDSLIVGDGKQAIYRFRGGEVEQFSVLPAIYGSHADALLKEREIAVNNYGAEVIPLVNNYRSRKAIIDFNNALYEQLLQLPELKNKAIYEDYYQEQGRQDTGGMVRVEFLHPAEDENMDDLRCLRVHEIVKEVIAKGYDYRDVAVLTRSNHSASIIASYLVSRGLQVVSPESLLIHHSPRVRLLLSLLTYLDRKDNHIARLEVMHFTHLLQQRSVPYEQLHLTDSVEKFEEELSAKTGVDFDSSKLPTGRLMDLLYQLVADFKIDSDDPFVQFFMDESLQYAARYGNHINEFLQWWDEVKSKKSMLYPESMNAVRIMTIHKSKGLQFPVVILPDANSEFKPNKKFLWIELKEQWLPQLQMAILPVNKKVQDTAFAPLYDRETEQSFLDMLNLLYVATTRPEDALYVLSEQLPAEPESIHSWTALLIEFLKRTARWEGFQTYVFGDPAFARLQQAHGKLKVPLYAKTYSPPTHRAAAAMQIKLNPVLLWNEQTAAKIDAGKWLHEILKMVKWQGDEEQALRTFAAGGELQEADLVVCKEKLKSITHHPALSAFFQPDAEVINERPLLKRGEKMRIPDRVVRLHGKVTVIDYKTGHPRPEYQQQLQEYADWLTEAGVAIDRKILFYTTTFQADVLP